MSKISGSVILVCVFSLILVPSHGVELKIPGKIINIAFTPFTNNGTLNLPMVSKLAKYYADRNITNLLITEFDSDGATLRPEERRALVAAWAREGCSFGLNIIVEVGLQAFVNTLSLARFCSELNVTAITHFPEQVYKAENIEEAIEDLMRVSEAAPNIPLIYNELLSTAPEISTDAVYLAADRVPTFCGVETSIDTYNVIEAITTNSSNSSQCNKQIWIYDIQNMYSAFLLGLKSATLAPNLFPQTVKDLEAAADNCDRDKAKLLQTRMNSWVAAIANLDGGTQNTYSRTYLSNIKAAFEEISGMNLGARVPVDKTNSTDYNRIASNLRFIGIPTAGSGSQQ